MEMEPWKHGDIDMRRGNMETWRHGDMRTWGRTWRHGHGDMDMKTWTRRHGDMDMETWIWIHGIKIWGNSDIYNKKIKWKMENGSQATFLDPFIVSSVCKRKFVVCPFVGEETNESYSFGNGLNGLNRLFHRC